MTRVPVPHRALIPSEIGSPLGNPLLSASFSRHDFRLYPITLHIFGSDYGTNTVSIPKVRNTRGSQNTLGSSIIWCPARRIATRSAVALAQFSFMLYSNSCCRPTLCLPGAGFIGDPAELIVRFTLFNNFFSAWPTWEVRGHLLFPFRTSGHEPQVFSYSCSIVIRKKLLYFSLGVLCTF
jgi:hypothetical protein